MNESFLHYLWQHQAFNHQQLVTTSGEQVDILFQGFHNQNSGPDFLQARIRIGDVLWVGAVEIHIRASDFLAHRHQFDSAYGIVVLHVVWQGDCEIQLLDGYTIPMLVLNDRISVDDVDRYNSLLSGYSTILCKDRLRMVPKEIVQSMIHQATARRLEQKTRQLSELLLRNQISWREIKYRQLVRSFGLTVNTDAFERLSELIPLQWIDKIRGDQLSIESLLFGVAGFLEGEPADSYHQTLQNQFEHLKRKFSIVRILDRIEWKFHRMRPANFPTYRMARLAGFLNASTDLWSWPPGEDFLKQFKHVLALPPSAYWNNHFRFGVEKNTSSKHHVESFHAGDLYFLSLINVWIPCWLVLARELNDFDLKNWVLYELNRLPPENNRIIRKWSEVGITALSASDSQGLLHHYHHCCANKRCLECGVGLFLLGRSDRH